MALLGNYSLVNKIPVKYFGGTTGDAQVRSNFNQSGRYRNRMYPDQTTTALPLYSVPTGSYPTLAFLIAQKSGSLGSGNQIYGSGISTSNLAGGKNAVASISGAGDLSSSITGLAPAAASLVGAGDMSGSMTALGTLLSALNGAGSLSGSPLAVALIAASLTGSGSASATLVGAANLLATLLGSGTISNPNLTLIASILANLIGSGSISAVPTAQGSLAATLAGTSSTAALIRANGALLANVNGVGSLSLTPYAIGDMGASITGESALSPQSLASAVWNALAAQYLANGTMGQKLNAAASGNIDYATLAEAILAAMNASPPDVNIAKINGLGVDGAGTEANPWGPV